MLEGLHLIHFPNGLPAGISEGARANLQRAMTLTTCQRYLSCQFQLGTFPWSEELAQQGELLKGHDAYRFLLEVLCGLKSKMAGEHEIVGQFKDAYRNYLSSPARSTQLMDILERLFKDAKEVRTQHLKAIGQQSYAGITRKVLRERAQECPVDVLGSGALARDLLQALAKHHPVTLCARNAQSSEQLLQSFPGTGSRPWSQDWRAHADSAVIVNTIGANQILFPETFFDQWRARHQGQCLFIDLGHPSVVQTPHQKEDGVIRLGDILERALELTARKEAQLNEARRAIQELAFRRRMSFTLNLPFGWEELQFA